MTWVYTLRQAFMQPSALTLFFFGLASGLPFLLVGGTLSVWLKEGGMSIEHIGLFSLAGLAYSFKFLWAPAIDRLELPFLGRLGKRRSWLVFAQCLLAFGLILMSVVTPSGSLYLLIFATVLAAFAGATLDVVVDAYRIEIAPPECQGALAATATLGYRIALVLSGALALWLADHIAWSIVYQLLAACVLMLVAATLLSREPEVCRTQQDEGKDSVIQDSLMGPFREFFQRYAGFSGLALLAFMGLLKMPDQMIGVMALPFYLDCGFTKTDIAEVSKLFGVIVGVAGAFLGGALVMRLGVQRCLVQAILLGAVSNLLFLLLARYPGDKQVFMFVIGGENLVGGFLGTVAVAWLSSLVSRAYTATQYALFSSFIALPGKLVGGVSGFIVKDIGYEGLFILSVLSVVPALLLYGWLQKYVPWTNGDSKDDPDHPD
jgi:PAT family beta-lactamase induction signal transducer AmpG